PDALAESAGAGTAEDEREVEGLGVGHGRGHRRFFLLVTLCGGRRSGTTSSNVEVKGNPAMDRIPGHLRRELTVGEVAARSGVPVSTLHFYEAKGLIRSHRSPGNQRRYDRDVLR